MSSVNVSDHLLKDAKKYAAIELRSISKQIEYWCKIGKMADENPDLPLSFIKEALLSREETKAEDLADYSFES